jgi:hypothetical protein
MGFFTKVYNKVQYNIAKWTNDPEADNYARNSAAQEAQDAETQRRFVEQMAQAQADTDRRNQENADAKSFAERSQFKPGRALNKISSGIINAFLKIIILAVLLYSGHLAANEAIGYNVPFRLLSFACGFIFPYYVIPRFLYQKFYLKKQMDYYTFLPVSTYEPNGDYESLFLGGFCYKKDERYAAARAAVESLYNTGYHKSLIEPKKET